MKKENSMVPYIIVGIVLVILFFTVVPAGREIARDWKASLKEVDETSYQNSKVVEDTARSMIASYKSDLLTYETYITSDDKEEQSWAKQAKIRANKTAIEYNEFLLKNSHIWEENIPDDINVTLPTIE